MAKLATATTADEVELREQRSSWRCERLWWRFLSALVGYLLLVAWVVSDFGTGGQTFLVGVGFALLTAVFLSLLVVQWRESPIVGPLLAVTLMASTLLVFVYSPTISIRTALSADELVETAEFLRSSGGEHMRFEETQALSEPSPPRGAVSRSGDGRVGWLSFDIAYVCDDRVIFAKHDGFAGVTEGLVSAPDTNWRALEPEVGWLRFSYPDSGIDKRCSEFTG